MSGVSDLSYLWKSQLPTVGPDLVARGEVAIALGLGFGLAVGALLGAASFGAARRDARRARSAWLERLVAGLDDDEVALECGRLDAGEVIPLALTDLAERLAPLAAELGSDALVFVVLAQDEIGIARVEPHGGGASDRRVSACSAGRPAPTRAELRMTFPDVPEPARRARSPSSRPPSRPAGSTSTATRRSSRPLESGLGAPAARCLAAATGQ